MSDKEKDIIDMQVWLFRMAERKWHMSPIECAELFEKWNIFGYISRCYDILHLSSYECALQDVENYLDSKGVKVC